MFSLQLNIEIEIEPNMKIKKKIEDVRFMTRSIGVCNAHQLN